MSRLAAVVGLTIERAILRRSKAFEPPAARWIAVAGASASRAETLAQALLAQGATALLSIGIAGGLDPALRPGLVILATEIVEPGGAKLPVDAAWRARVAAAIKSPQLREAAIAGADQMLAGVHQKTDLYRRTLAAAVDMESHGVARAAARQSVPFLALRAIADPAGRALPQSAAAGMDEDGRMQPLATAAALLAHPRDLRALIGVAGDAGTALVRLWQAVARAGRDLAPL
jgi:hopanoid-associated phosphorylase